VENPKKGVNPDAPDWTDPLIPPEEAPAYSAICHGSVGAVVIENLDVPASCGQPQPALCRLGCFPG